MENDMNGIVQYLKNLSRERAKKRIEGENVCGNKVNCTFARPIEREFSRTRQQELFGSAWRPVESKNFEQRDEDYSYQNSYRRSSNEELPMENPSKGFWNKSSGYSSTMTDNSYNNAWRMQSPPIMANGHAFTNSPTFNSSQGSSREASPSYFLRKSEPQSTYRASPSGFPVNNGIPHSVHDRSQHLRYSKPSAHIWPDNNANGSQCSRFQTVDHTFGLGNLSLADTQESMSSMSHAPVELLITNLDQNIDAREMKKILLAWFRERVMVLHVSVFVQSDGYLAATITVPSQLDAQYAISQLHRKRIGTKRIVISHITHVQQPPEIKRSKVLTLLKEVPGRKLPLFKFRELYERRYQETIGVSEMYNMRDLISVSDNSTGRMVCLNSEYWSLHSYMSESNLQNPDELRYCKFHSKGPDKSVGWAERDHSAILPNVCLTLKEVGNAMQILLNSHSGNIPLASLVDCYREEVGPLPEDPNGVPLEHLISCLSGLLIVVSTAGFKYVRRSDSRNSYDPDDLSRYVSPPLVGHLALFSRELVDLLKTFPHCQMLLSRFIPAYHHHFGRQCRVADYGYTKLSDLLVSLPHLIQIMGEGTKKTLTLSHRVQVKRFSSDLLRVLKGQPFKMITLQDFPEAFEKSMGRPWNVTDYGVCEIMDLLREIQETTVVLKNTPEGTTIAIPKREQTAEEIERTRLFATEVVELLRHSPQCKMQFNRFIPAYHHHFGRQCRVSDFGFSKLIELLEAIPDVLQVLGEDEEGERNLQLVEKERIRILGDQIFTLVKNSPKQMIGISALAAVFMHYYGYSLKPSHYKCDEFEELIGKLRHYVKIEEQDGEPKVTLVDRSSIDELWTKTRKLLWDEPKCSLPYDKFVEKYMQLYESTPDLEVLKRDLQDYLMVLDDSEGNGEIELDPVQVFARDLLILLNEAGGRMLLINLESSYLNRFGVACRPASLGYPNLTALLQSFGDLVIIKGKRTKRIIVLNREKVPDLPNYSPPVPVQNHTEIEADSKWEEYGCIPVPPPPSQTMGGSVPNFVQGVPPTSCDQKLYNKDLQGSHMIMGVTPPPPQQTYQPASPVIYSGSPAGPNGSVVWGQVWSPQYSVIPPVSPAHYMMPTIPINWGNIPSASLAPTSNIKERENHKGRAPVSIKTLEQLGKETPPNPCELPSPEYLTNNGDLVAEGLFPDIEECALASGGISESRDQSSQNFSKKSGCAF